jgi:tight adherence protein C
MTPQLEYVAIAFIGMVIIVAAAAVLLFGEYARGTRLSNRIEYVTTGGENFVESAKPEGSPILRAISAMGMGIARSGLLNRQTLGEMTATLESGGFRGGRGLGLFIGAKLLFALILPVITYTLARHFFANHLYWLVGGFAGFVLGMLIPDKIVGSLRARHLAAVSAGVPDALDMLVICSDAGLALEAGLNRVAAEMSVLNPAMSQELNQTSRELQIGSDMRKAMESLGQRTGLDTLKRLASTLSQSLQYGTPLTDALRALSAELRQEALIAFEERAGRLPTLMTVPMILFILPCVFLIVAGPAIINVLAITSGSK